MGACTASIRDRTRKVCIRAFLKNGYYSARDQRAGDAQESRRPFFLDRRGLCLAADEVVPRYPSTNVIASGWLKGEELMAGRAAVVSIDMSPGKVVLFGLRPQHRAQTHATFPLLFNALYLSALGDAPARTSNSEP